MRLTGIHIKSFRAIRDVTIDSAGNIYDAIEKVYELNSVELAGVLDVSMGVLGYASTQRTIPKRKRQFSSRLHIPESFFDEFLSTQLDALKKCREEFRDCYGDELIETELDGVKITYK